MAGAVQKDCSLRELLDRFVDAQRKDIDAYCSGHLNESRLCRPPVSSPTTVTWDNPSSKLSSLQKNATKSNEKMTDALADFAAGTSVLTAPRALKPLRVFSATGAMSVRKSDNHADSSLTRSSSGTKIEQRLSDSVSSHEERRPTALTPLSSSRTSIKQRPQSHVEAQPRRNAWIPNVVPPFQDAATKKEQFKKMKDFRTNVLHQSDDMHRQNVLSGVEAVEHLEKRLQQDLEALNASNLANDGGPSFHRLQVYSDVFDELVDSSPTFHYLLLQIKNAYDEYVALLIDRQSGGHDQLRNDIGRLSVSHADVGPAIEEETARVRQLEDRARELLQENESILIQKPKEAKDSCGITPTYFRLRAEIEKEKELASLPEQVPPTPPPLQPERVDVSERIEQLRNAILDKIDAVRELRAKLRTSFVPSSVCTYLSQCVKDTEVEIQKIMSQKEFFEQNIHELEKELRDAVESADTTERDAKRIWKRIEALKIDGDASAADGIAAAELADEDESAKWSWYIS